MKRSFVCTALMVLLGAVISPAWAQTPTNIAVTNHDTIHIITWTDQANLTGETYNVYMSPYPITNVQGSSVYLVGTGIPEGQQSYEYKLYTPFTSGSVTCYYAVTSVVNGVENTTLSAGDNVTVTGEAGTTVNRLAMVWVDGTIFNPPTIDGDLSEWMEFPFVYIDPSSPDNMVTAGVIDGPQDLSGYFYYAADGENFYFAADVTDDYLENIWSYDMGDVWKGDSPEYYLGVYDLRPSEPRHEDYMTGAEPDFHILIKANAGTNPCFHIYTNGKTILEGTPTNTEQWCGPKVTGDLTSGWVVEAKLPYEALKWDPLNAPIHTPTIGWVLPTNIGINDTDVPGLGEREGQLMWSNHPDAGASWDRPDVWKHEVVIYDPKMFAPSPPPEVPYSIAVTNYDSVHVITWSDQKDLVGETYNVYVSESPITDVHAPHVYLIGTNIPEGQMSYEYQLYWPDKQTAGQSKTFYYAVTSVSAGVENTRIVPETNATTSGEPGTTTWGLAAIWFDGTHFSPPTYDGNLGEWPQPFSVFIDSLSPNYPIITDVVPPTISGSFWLGADADNLYFAGDVTDDALVNIWPADDGNMWKGDGVEYYLGLYDQRPSEPPHQDYQTSPEPDFQINIKANAGTDPAFHIYTNSKCDAEGKPTNTEQWCGAAGNGWRIEARLPYTALEWDPLNQPVPRPAIGWVMPANIALNDTDTPGLGVREGELMWSNDPDAGASWDRPDVWKHQVVVYDPKLLKDIYQPTKQVPTNITVTNHDTVHIISWNDAVGLSGESYNVYMSPAPITDLSSDSVYLIGTQIPEGQESYEYQLFAPFAPRAVSYYYAVTSVVNGVENTDLSPGDNVTTTGEPGTTTWALAMVWLDGKIFIPPTLDGDLKDWDGHRWVYIDPTSPTNSIVAGRIDDAQDLSGYFYYAADENNLYFAADVTDDYLENIWTADQGDVWKGDGVEFYLGLYDQRPSDAPHTDFQVQPEPDYHILIKANAGTGPAFHIYTNGKTSTEGKPTNTEQWCGPRVVGDPTSGWIVEAKLPYEALSWDPVAYPQVIRPAIGWVLPTNIGINDTDVPTLGEREGQLMWSNDPDAGASWDRPDVWKHRVVIYDPKMLAWHERPSGEITITNRDTVHIIQWTDSQGLVGETYNIYVSESPITDISAPNVYRIATHIPEGVGSYEYRLYTPFQPGSVTNYYAVTSVVNGVENSTIVPGVNATTVGEPGTTTWGMPAVWVESPPIYDGSLTEWQDIPRVHLDPTSPENSITAGIFNGPQDMSGYLWLGVDEENLYFAGDITDDVLVNIWPADMGDMWKGDGVEYFLGLYDLRPSEPPHKDYQTSPEPDFQIDIKANAGTDDAFHIYTNGKTIDVGLTGTTQWCGAAGSGWRIEAQMPYTKLEWDPLNQPVPRPAIGWVMPANIALNDGDTPGAGEREGQLMWSNHPDAGASWDRPDVWKHRVVVYDPKLLRLVGKPAVSYQIQIAAYSDIASDLNNYAGVSPSATNGFDPGLDQPEPPPPPTNYLQLYFPHPEWNHNLGERFSHDIRASVDLSEAALVWDFIVVTDLPQQEITVKVQPQWDKIPQNYNVLLKDTESGVLQDLRADTSAYRYVSGATGGQRRFQLIVGNTQMSTLQRAFNAGWNLISIPVEPSNATIDSIFGNDIAGTYYVVEFDQATGYFSADSMQPGRGYWLGLSQSDTVKVHGHMLTDGVSLTLHQGNNLVGNPFPYTISTDNLIFVKENQYKGIAEAATSGWVQDVLYTYAAGDSGYRQGQLLQAWQGFWLPVLAEGVELTITASAAPLGKSLALSEESQQPSSVHFWRLSLYAAMDSTADLLTQLGVDTTATDGFDPHWDYSQPPPPPGGDYVELYFPHPEWNIALGSRYNHDIRAPLKDQETKTWNLEVHTSKTGPVTLKWPHLSLQAPKGHRFLLIDADACSGSIINMRKNQSYQYLSTGLHHFRIEVHYEAAAVEDEIPHLSIPTTFELSQNYPNPFNPDTRIDYALPRPSHVMIAIYNLAGQKVRTLVDADKPAGRYSLRWDGTDTQGKSVASGVYFYRMQADSFVSCRKLILMR